jgi:hypothetical protein
MILSHGKKQQDDRLMHLDRAPDRACVVPEARRETPMSTHAQIAIRTGPGEWTHVYVHYDGYPAHMLPALAGWTPEQVLAAREIRQVTPDALDAFDPPRAPRRLSRPTREMSHLYTWLDGHWVEIDPGRG